MHHDVNLSKSNDMPLGVVGLPESGEAILCRTLDRALKPSSDRLQEAASPFVRVVRRVLAEKCELELDQNGFPITRWLLVVRDPIVWTLTGSSVRGSSPSQRMESWLAAHEEFLNAVKSRSDKLAILSIERFVISPRAALMRSLESLEVPATSLSSPLASISASDRQKFLKTYRDSTAAQELARKFALCRDRFVQLGYDPSDLSPRYSESSKVSGDDSKRSPAFACPNRVRAAEAKIIASKREANSAPVDGQRNETIPIASCPPGAEAVANDLAQPSAAATSDDRRPHGDAATVAAPRETFMPGARPLRVGFLTPSLRLGGAERWMVSLAKSSDPRKIEWTGTALSPWGLSDSPIAAELRKLMPIYTSTARNRSPVDDPSITRLSTAQESLDAVAGRADVLISWGAPQPTGAGKRHDCRSVFVSHCSFPTTGTIHSASLEGVHLVAVSAAARASFSELLKSRATIIHNGVEEERCVATSARDEIRASWGFQNRHRLIGYIGRASQEKNPLAAASAVQALGGEFRAVYVSSGHQQDEIRRAAKEMIGDGVVFVPPMEPIGNALAAIDVFLLASPSEGFSLALGEAWLAGVPTVATRVGAVPELEDRHGPLVVPVPVNPSAQELAEAVRSALSEDNRETIERARAVMKSEYTSKRMAERWCDYLYGLMEIESAR